MKDIYSVDIKVCCSNCENHKISTDGDGKTQITCDTNGKIANSNNGKCRYFIPISTNAYFRPIIVPNSIKIRGTAKWKERERANICSRCGGWGLDSFKYCPHCGSEIRSDDK